MKNHRIGLLAFTLSSIAALASANAADMYRGPEGVSSKDAPVYAPLWTGFYAGGNSGYGWSARDSGVSDVETVFFNVLHVPATGLGTFSDSKSFSTEGGFGGGQIGYNWQGIWHPHLVLGIEADIQGAGINGSGKVSPGGAISLGPAIGSVSGGATDGSALGKDELNWFGTARGRLGYAAGSTLFYFTGGFAFGGVKDTLTVTIPVGNPQTVSKDHTDTGYVLGGGVEHLFNPSWSVKVEYQYIDIGSDKLSAATSGNGTIINVGTLIVVKEAASSAATLDAQHAYHTVRLGLNYHLDASYEPLK